MVTLILEMSQKHIINQAVSVISHQHLNMLADFSDIQKLNESC